MPINIGQKTVVKQVNIGFINIIFDNLFEGATKTINVGYYVGENVNDSEHKTLSVSGDDAESLFANLNIAKDLYDRILAVEGVTDVVVTKEQADADILISKKVISDITPERL